MREKVVLLLILLSGSAIAAKGQDIPLPMRLRIERSLKAEIELVNPFDSFNSDPMLEWRRAKESRKYSSYVVRQRVANTNLAPVKEYFQRPRSAFQFQVSIVSNNILNASPYSDKALDARIIRYPMRVK